MLLLGEPVSELDYWKRRAQRYGKRSVLNLAHDEAEYDHVTVWQQREIFPHFVKMLDGTEQYLVDFGCGPGRHTGELARLINGEAIGVDPTEKLLLTAPQQRNVTYQLMQNGLTSLPNACADVVWVCLVLGGLRDNSLQTAIHEIDRLLKPNGLLFLVENTAEKDSSKWWTFRSIEEYKNLFPNVTLEYIDGYFDVNESISMIAGRKSLRGVDEHQ